jgi:hypothetical protein
MCQMDLWERLAECRRAIRATNDPKMREMLTHLRALWISFAHESQTPGASAPAEQVATLAKIHGELTKARARWVSLTKLDDIRGCPNLSSAGLSQESHCDSIARAPAPGPAPIPASWGSLAGTGHEASISN